MPRVCWRASAPGRTTCTARRSRARSTARASRGISRATSSPSSGTPRSRRSLRSSPGWTPSTAPRCVVSRRARMRADRAFALVLGLGLLSSAILGALLAAIVPHAMHVLRVGPDDLVDAVTLLVLTLATCGIALGLGSLFRQLFMTLALIRSLVARRIPTPDHVATIARELGIHG